MNFTQLAKNRWRCVIEGPSDPNTGKRRQISRTGKTKTEAKRRAEEALEELNLASEYNANVTFEEFCEYFMRHYRLKGNKENTIIYREYCLSLINKYIAKSKLRKITPIMLQEILNDLFEKKKSQHTIKGVHNTMNQLFKYAVDSRLIAVSPATSLLIPRDKQRMIEDIKAEVEGMYLESHELVRLLEEADKHRNVLFRTVIYVAAFTGMRPGEILALKMKDIDFEGKRIFVTKTIHHEDRIKKNIRLGPPKTFNSNRIIEVDDIVIDKINALLNHKRLKDWPITDFLFSDREGLVPTVQSLNSHVKRLGIKAQIEKRCKTYILRHTHVSLLAEAGVDLQYIMNRVGHSDSKTTTRIYLHVTEGMRQNAASLMHKKFTQLLK